MDIAIGYRGLRINGRGLRRAVAELHVHGAISNRI
jgi:hypothetical protein